MQRYLFLLGFLLLGLTGRATEITLSSASGHPGETVDVTVGISSPGEATALEVAIPLPQGVEFATGSAATLTTTSHAASGNVKNGELKLILHSFSLESLPAGNLMKFSLRLGKTPGNFTLAPRVILSDRNGNALDATAQPSVVTVLSPAIQLSPTFIDFGRQPIRGSYTRSFSIINTGNETLTVTAIEPSAPEFTVETAMPFTVAAGSSASVNFTYSPMARAKEITENLTVRSDAVNGNARLNLSAIPYSVNELHVANQLSGNGDETVTVMLRLNNMEPIQGVQTTFTLPDALQFVEGSLQTIGRASAFSATCALNGNKLTLIAYSVAGATIDEGDDNILAFDLRLNGSSGWYYLNPENVILSNPGMENMTSASSGQYVVINSPSISVPSALDFGNVSVGGEGTASLSVYNAGQAPLTIERVILTNEIFTLDRELPLTLQAYQSAAIPFKVAPTREGRQAAEANIYSNDPENRLKTVNFTVDAFESNQLTLSGSPNDDYTAYTLSVGLDNYTEITALQMDVRWIEGMTAGQQDVALSARCNGGHTYSVAPMGNGVYRIILFSFANTPFAGNEGELFTLTFHGRDFVGTTLSAENIILSSPSGKNYTSPGATITVVSVEGVKVSQIELSSPSLELKATETASLTATVIPSNAEIKTVSWTSTNPAVATVSPEGVVTAIAIGETTVTALADDDSGVKAECTVRVVPTPAESISISAEGQTRLMATEIVQLTATVLPETTTDKTVTWKSDNIEVATVNQDGLVTAVSVGEAVITATNSAGQTDQITVTVIPTPVSSIELSQSSAIMQATQKLTLTATVLPTTATEKGLAWSTSDKAVATVSPEGVVTAIAVGTASIKATAIDGSDVEATCSVTVIPTLAASIEISAEGETTLKATESVQLTATVLPETTTDKSVSWSSNNPDVASVSSEGLVTAHAVGSAVITATNSAGQTDQITITVIATPVSSITFNQSQATLKATETLTLMATVLPETATVKTLNWSSSDSSVATVSQEGVVTAIAVGSATIKAEATDGSEVSAECAITVVTTPAESITISAEGETTLKATETVQLTATVLPETTTDKSVNWNSNNPDVASVSDNGLVTAHAVGEAIITATNSAGQTDQVTITVIATPVSSITLNQTSATMQATQTLTLRANLMPATATEKGIAWSTSDEAVATVSPEGVVTAIAVGSATIKAKAIDGSDVEAICTVTVIPTLAASIEISAEGETTLKATETVQLTATVLPETTTDKSVSWSSNNPDVAYVSDNGLVTANSVGSAVITATNSAGQTDQITIMVIATPVSSITFNQSQATLKATETLTLTATVQPETATVKVLNWSSSDSSVATVSQEGVVTAIAVGSATITASATDGSDVSAECAITVVATPAESIEISAEGETTLKATETVQLTATVLPETTTDKSVNWNSNNPDVASVSENGLVTANSVGSAVITATNSAGQNDQITITVVATPVSEIILSRNTVAIKVTTGTKLEARIVPETATNKMLNWVSSRPDIVSVDNDGNILGLQLGEAIITCEATDGSGVSAQCVVTVGETAAESIEISAEGETTLKASETVQLTATVLPETTTDKSVNWSSSNPDVASVSETGLVTAHAVGTAVITATNSAGQTDQITITVIATPVSSITFNQSQATLKATETLTLTANVLPETATVKTLNWSSSDTRVATVSQEGVVTAIAVGSATIKAEATDGSGVSAECAITVVTTPAESIEISAEGETTLKATETVQLTATVLPETTTDKSVSWSSSMPEVASVSAEGLVTAHAVGTAVITATNSAGQTDQVTITVIATPVSSITLNQTSATMQATQTLTLRATVMPATATEKGIAWSTSDEAVATVSPEGVVTAIAVGTATIKATAMDGSNVEATCTVTVIPTLAASIEISAEGETTLKATETVQLTATVLSETTTDKSVSWSSNNPDVASVSETGLVTAHAVGSAVITATNSAGQTDQITITVIATPVSSIMLNQTQATLKATETLVLTANVLPETATVKALNWSSSDTSVAIVSPEGVVTAIAVGSATIKAEAIDGSGVSAECAITVVETPAESITISAEGETTLKATETVQLTATVLPETTTDKSVSWSSSMLEVASVSPEGLVTAHAVGETVITATNSAGQTDQISITVIATPVSSITLNTGSASVRVDEGFQLLATILPETATNKAVEWSSSDTSIVVVDDEGNVMGKALGTATITCRATDGSDVEAGCMVTVVATPAESIEISAEGETTLKATETLQLSAVVLPESATDKTVTWLSANPDVAVVNSDGLVTAMAVGETTITATNSAGQNAQITVTVVPTPVSAIMLSQTSATVYESETLTLTATVLPETATVKDLEWTSSDLDVAIVAPDGTVNAIGAGEATITATATDGSGVSSSCRITVLEVVIPAEGIRIVIDSQLELTVGDTYVLMAEIYPAETTDRSVRWESSFPNVADVDDSGAVTAIAEGETDVYAYDAYGHSDSVHVIVAPAEAGLDTIFADGTTRVDVYDVNGILLRRNASKDELKTLDAGIYIINAIKYIISR